MAFEIQNAFCYLFVPWACWAVWFLGIAPGSEARPDRLLKRGGFYQGGFAKPNESHQKVVSFGFPDHCIKPSRESKKRDDAWRSVKSGLCAPQHLGPQWASSPVSAFVDPKSVARSCRPPACRPPVVPQPSERTIGGDPIS